MKSRIEAFFESFLWSSRTIVLVAVVVSLVVSVVLFYITTVDAVVLVHGIASYASPALDEAARKHAHVAALGTIAEIVDGYLFATVLIIFALGLYELFISKIDAAEHSELASRLLLIDSVDALKERLAKVVFLILIVRYFEYALEAKIEGGLDLLYLAIGIALVAFALYLTSDAKHAKKPPA